MITKNKSSTLAAARSKPLGASAKKLRRTLLRLLRDQGFAVGRKYELKTRGSSKKMIRAIHTHFREDHLRAERAFVHKWYPRISHYFASGKDVDPNRIDPYPVLVEGIDEHAALFRIASLWWSIPVSQGYGRRFRILIFDRSNGKLFGLLALTDPVFNLRTRDAWIGWEVRAREDKLAHVMDACVLGAVPPYNSLLGAKFVSLLAASDFTRQLFRRRYGKKKSIIRKRYFDGRLALVTTTSALGTSSILNRLRFGSVEVFQPVGFTQGYGHFHLANGTFEKIRTFLTKCRDEETHRYKFGSGPNYRIRVVRKALERLQLPPELLRHGIRRGVYVAPLARNSSQFLRGNSSRLLWYQRPLPEIVRFWRERWMLPRAARDASYLAFDSLSWKKILNLDHG
jgi:Druantia protein DruA